ncbi:MAG TPA: hypothetical protein VFS19_06700 [Planctomycetota bacterium]|nr:hypothetical protein [Planctomycetota bacterium]
MARAKVKEADISHLAVSLFDKVRIIKGDHPGIARQIDRLEREVRERLESIRDQIAKLNRQDRELVTVLVINGLHRTADEVLIEK